MLDTELAMWHYLGMANTRWILQTYFPYNDLEERGFNLEFATEQEARDWAKQNMCGSRHTITPIAKKAIELLGRTYDAPKAYEVAKQLRAADPDGYIYTVIQQGDFARIQVSDWSVSPRIILGVY